MKTQAKVLELKKSSIVELNEKQLIKVQGGTTTFDDFDVIPTSNERPTTGRICNSVINL